QPPSWKWIVLSLASCLFILSQFYRVSNAIIAIELQKDLSLDAEKLGLIGASFFYAFALAQIPLAFSLDRVGARWTMTVLSLTATLGALIFATAQSPAAAIIGRILLGLGMAANLMGSMKLLTRWFSPREFATISGFILALGTLGNMVAATPLALLVEAMGWRWSFGIMAIFTFLISCLFFSFVRDAPTSDQAPSPLRQKSLTTSESLRRLLCGLDYWLISLGTFFRYGIFAAIQALWAGPYLLEGLGFSPVKAGNILLLLNLGYLAGGPIAGWLADRVFGSPRKSVLLAFSGMALSLLVLSGGWGQGYLWVLSTCFFFIGLFSGFGFMTYAHIKHLMPIEMTGTAVTGINLFSMLGGAVILQAMGWVVDHWTGSGGAGPDVYEFAFFLGFIGMAAVTGPYFFTKEHRVETE
ncbi:MAG: MFS transporter, partial [Pseudomonadota bacterium]